MEFHKSRDVITRLVSIDNTGVIEPEQKAQDIWKEDLKRAAMQERRRRETYRYEALNSTSIRPVTSPYFSIRQHTPPYVSMAAACEVCCGGGVEVRSADVTSAGGGGGGGKGGGGGGGEPSSVPDYVSLEN
jgi:hypothetical protein